MTKWRILAMVLTAAGMLATDANAQPNLNPLAPVQPATYRYPVGPQAGAWLICVQTFKGDNAQQLAEEMAELLIRDKRYALSAYLCDRGGKERLEEQERVHQQRQQYDEWLNQMKSQGVEPSRRPFRLRTFNNTQEEFAVLVTVPNRPLKDMDDAHDFLVKKVRKLPPPPNKFMSQLNFTKEDPSGKKSDLVSDGFVNPFQFAMVFHNPTIPIEKQQADPEKADEFLKKLNAGESLSVLKCSKPWTLVVKVYQGQTVLEAPQSPSIMTSVGRGLGLIKKEPEILNAQTAQARATADLLRLLKFDAYVMHQSTYSLVTVGQYDSPTDPNLVAIQRSLTGLQLKNWALAKCSIRSASSRCR